MVVAELAMWLITGGVIFSAVLSARVAYANRPRGVVAERRRRALDHERTVQRACANLDAEYRALLRR